MEEGRTFAEMTMTLPLMSLLLSFFRSRPVKAI